MFALILAALVGLAFVALASGAWRVLFRPLTIRPDALSVARLDLDVAPGADTERVDAVLRHFALGFNRTLTARSEAAWRAVCEAVEPLYRPFAEEGAAMAYTPRHLLWFQGQRFEERLVKVRPEFRYLYYVGLGFWSGLSSHKPARVARIARDLDPLHNYLCFDGYGFARTFFHYRKSADALRRLDGLTGYARNAAYQGVGRALYFLYMGRPERLVEHIERMGDFAPDAAAGVGLAAMFVNPDRMPVVHRLAERMPSRLRPHFHLGMCFALKARSINDRPALERQVERLDPGQQAAVWASIRECDRIELLVRSRAGGDEGYRTWRCEVTEWLVKHIRYPMVELEPAQRDAATSRLAALASERKGEVSW